MQQLVCVEHIAHSIEWDKHSIDVERDVLCMRILCTLYTTCIRTDTRKAEFDDGNRKKPATGRKQRQFSSYRSNSSSSNNNNTEKKNLKRERWYTHSHTQKKFIWKTHSITYHSHPHSSRFISTRWLHCVLLSTAFSFYHQFILSLSLQSNVLAHKRCMSYFHLVVAYIWAHFFLVQLSSSVSDFLTFHFD